MRFKSQFQTALHNAPYKKCLILTEITPIFTYKYHRKIITARFKRAQEVCMFSEKC